MAAGTADSASFTLARSCSVLPLHGPSGLHHTAGSVFAPGEHIRHAAKEGSGMQHKHYAIADLQLQLVEQEPDNFLGLWQCCVLPGIKEESCPARPAAAAQEPAWAAGTHTSTALPRMLPGQVPICIWPWPSAGPTLLLKELPSCWASGGPGIAGRTTCCPGRLKQHSFRARSAGGPLMTCTRGTNTWASGLRSYPKPQTLSPRHQNPGPKHLRQGNSAPPPLAGRSAASCAPRAAGWASRG